MDKPHPLLRRPRVPANIFESGYRRARREYHEFATNTVQFIVWLSLWTLFGAALGLWFSWGHGRNATVEITTAAGAVGFAAALGIPLCWLWMTAPVVQRDEERALTHILRTQIENDRRQANEAAAERRRIHELRDHLTGRKVGGTWDYIVMHLEQDAPVVAAGNVPDRTLEETQTRLLNTSAECEAIADGEPALASFRGRFSGGALPDSYAEMLQIAVERREACRAMADRLTAELAK